MASARALRESLGVLALAVLLTVFHTYPVAFQLGRVGRVDSGDGRWSVWVVNWVAHGLLTDPANLFNANIFFAVKNCCFHGLESSAGMTRGDGALTNFVSRK